MPYNQQCQRYGGYSNQQCQHYGGYSINTPGDNKATLIVFAIFIPFFLLFLIILGSVLGGVLGTSGDSSGSTTERDPSALNLSPGVTRNVSFGNPFFCSEVTFEVKTPRASAEVYLITDTPPLTHRNSFSRNIRAVTSLTVGRSSHFWNYRVYSGSNVTISLYLHRAPSPGIFSVFRGRCISFSEPSPSQRIISGLTPCTAGYTRKFSF